MSKETTNTSADFECQDDAWPIGKKAAFYSIFVVVALAILDGLDRQIIAALLPYIKNDFHLTDTQLGSIVSILNFSIAIFVIPTAYLVDNWSRKKTMALMCSVWSVATAACAFAGSFAHMFTARFFVGAGEAGYNPAAQALLSAQFPKKYRSTTLAMIQLGIALGSPLGLAIGGYLAAHYGWRHALGVVAIPGIFLAISALFIKDFKTQKPDPNTAGEAAPKESYLHLLLGFMKVPTLFCVFAGAALLLMFSGTVIGWLPMYFIREASMTPVAASGLAALMFLPNVIGYFLSGPIIDLSRRHFQNGAALVMCIGTAFTALCYIICFAFATPGGSLQIAIFLISGFAAVLASVGGPTLIMDLVPLKNRASAAGVLVACQNILGLGLGPLLTGFLSDMFTLGTAFLLMTAAPAAAALIYLVATFTYKKDSANVTCQTATF